ncbi:hypothetical protein Cgig2_002700 [Carnegiea gigantea]|uniref:Uncharacterized protein n=1 Tax=Carnegiea gigantea TaxID=171969 RepID=A0A9Q1QNN9_9CARY|nr:hypothetical protein Cgig2_002700 [Carnegiea gigantea]
MPSLQSALLPELANNSIRLHCECLQRAKYIGSKVRSLSFTQDVDLTITSIEQMPQKRAKTEQEKLEYYQQDVATTIMATTTTNLHHHCSKAEFIEGYRNLKDNKHLHRRLPSVIKPMVTSASFSHLIKIYEAWKPINHCLPRGLKRDFETLPTPFTSHGWDGGNHPIVTLEGFWKVFEPSVFYSVMDSEKPHEQGSSSCFRMYPEDVLVITAEVGCTDTFRVQQFESIEKDRYPTIFDREIIDAIARRIPQSGGLTYSLLFRFYYDFAHNSLSIGGGGDNFFISANSRTKDTRTIPGRPVQP